jgi:hypothetical protein
MKFIETPKDRKKVIRSVIQIIILLTLFIILLRALFNTSKYVAFDKEDTNIVAGEDNGFIAISYFGVDRDGTPTLISTDRLEEHLKALRKNGFVTISKDDIKEYYKSGTLLPKNALFLMFEDGRRDTVIFASKIMEKFNYLGTILSYAEKFETKDTLFLSPKELLDLQKSTFWEIGTNGYRLSYINVFDRYGNFVGELNSTEFNEMRKYLGRDYNQYLMDFIRDEDKVPKETYDEMKLRISNDYELMEKIYGEKLGKLPELYVLMHANTGRFADNDKVSDINEEWIKKLFTMNFNREGSAKNDRNTDLYDLTRMQPGSYWYPNHLLMRIKADTNRDIVFEDGDVKKKVFWEVVSGAPEFRKNVIALTSESKGNGLIRLKDSENYEDIKLSVTLTGNKLGMQKIYLRADENLEKYISVEIKNNILYVCENNILLYQQNLDEFDNKVFKSIEKDNLDALRLQENLYKRNKTLSLDINNVQEQIQQLNDNIDISEDYIPTMQINEAGNRLLTINLIDDNIEIKIDDKIALSDIVLTRVEKGFIYLESGYVERGYSQRNIVDDVYDGVFEDLTIWDEKEQILYDNSLRGFEKIIYSIKNTWNNIINWFIKTL